MSAESRPTYIDSSAMVKLAVAEAESAALRRYLSRHRTLVSSALARTEVGRALLPLGPEAVARGDEVLRRIHLLRINDRVLRIAGSLEPTEIRSLDAIHLASAQLFAPALKQLVTYDTRMAEAARSIGWVVATPS